MKVVEMEEARRLRATEGLSIRDISKKLGVSKGSVSRWVQDITLTLEQERTLQDRNPIFNRQKAGHGRNNQKYARIREEYQKQGIRDALKGEIQHAMLCMLYWAEGHKRNNRNAVKFANSDINMVKFFVNTLKNFYGVTNNAISMYLNHYTDVHSLKEAENFWLSSLNLPRSCMRKSTVNYYSKYTKNKRCSKLPFGTCVIVVCSTEILQRIYGSIQAYVGFNEPSWVTGTEHKARVA